ncbi:S1C family serine protease [Paenibacillus yanchengensis]|uniref:S1C family serine protease n=1 Tax=Paenibacillus yanchengensis TaxID=2035833 RepID=A0ABW4YNJ7_9BACL
MNRRHDGSRAGVGKMMMASIAGGLVAALIIFSINGLGAGLPVNGDLLSSGSQQVANASTVAAGPTNGALTSNLDFSSIVEQSNESVVLINTFAERGNYNQSPNTDDIFSYFFGQMPEQPQVPDSEQKQLHPLGAGSGFFYKDGGYILTNEHVVAGADRIEVTVQGYDEPFVAKVLGASPEHDLAVIKIDDKEKFKVLPIGDSSTITVGEWVVAIGNPLGFEHTVTVGVISAKEREVPISDERGQRQYRNLLQTDASINSGNSGGPLINLKGEVIGINTAKSANAQGIGFAIPTTVFVPLINYLEEGKTIPSAYIGVTVGNINETFVNELNLPSKKGAIVTSVLPGTPAFKAGIRQYDVILKVDGEEIADSKEAVNKIITLPVGEEVVITVWRDGAEHEFSVTIADKNEQPPINLQ